MNLGTLTTWASQFTSDPQQTRYAGLYTQAINEANMQFAMDSHCLFKDQTWSVLANTSNYALPSDFMYEKKVTISQNPSISGGTTGGSKLIPISRADIEFYKTSADWTQDTGTPRYYVIDPELARGNLLLYPQPQGADAGTNNLIMTYYPYPATLVNQTDNPLNNYNFLTQFHIGIAAYAAWLLLGYEQASDIIMSKRNDLFKKYQDKVTEAIDKYGNTASEPLRMRGGRIWR